MTGSARTTYSVICFSTAIIRCFMVSIELHWPKGLVDIFLCLARSFTMCLRALFREQDLYMSTFLELPSCCLACSINRDPPIIPMTTIIPWIPSFLSTHGRLNRDCFISLKLSPKSICFLDPRWDCQLGRADSELDVRLKIIRPEFYVSPALLRIRPEFFIWAKFELLWLGPI